MNGWLIETSDVELRFVVWREWVLIGGLPELAGWLIYVSWGVAALCVGRTVLCGRLAPFTLGVLLLGRRPALEGLTQVCGGLPIIPSLVLLSLVILNALALIIVLIFSLCLVVWDGARMLLARPIRIFVEVAWLVIRFILESILLFRRTVIRSAVEPSACQTLVWSRGLWFVSIVLVGVVALFVTHS